MKDLHLLVLGRLHTAPKKDQLDSGGMNKALLKGHIPSIAYRISDQSIPSSLLTK